MSIKVMLWYDVEDYINRESDDALLALIEMMDKRGVKGTFKLVGEKIRALESRGRNDILERLRRHDIGYHTDMHSEHPTISEYCERTGFKEGVREFEAREKHGLEDLKRITGMPVSTYGQPGAAWAPQVFPALKKWGISTYVDYNHVIDLDCKPFWFCGILCVTLIPGIMRMELEEGGLEQAKACFDNLAGQGEKLISIFYHPCEFATLEFWDAVNYSRGDNTPRDQWRESALRGPERMNYYVGMLGEFIDYLLSKGCEFITTSRLLGTDGLFKEEGGRFTPGDVKALASAWRSSPGYAVSNGTSLSASEIFLLCIRLLQGLPLDCRLVYGPEKDVPTEPGAGGTAADIRKAVSVDFPVVEGFLQLPDFFMVNGKKVNPADMACTVAHIVARDIKEDEKVDIIRGSLVSEGHIRPDEEWGRTWIIFPEDFEAPNLVKMAKLQSWTLKPALFKTK